MSWLRLDDGFADDPAIIHLARSRGEADRILGMVTALMIYCARHLTDGYVPALIFNEHVRSKRLRELLTDPPDGATALIHPRDATCECLEGRRWPPTGADYFVHHYLKANPTRDEYDLARAKAAELRDRELLTAVRRRDRDRCRYCDTVCTYADRRSSRGLVFDHVDPAVAAGAANLVVACRGCNSRKNNRTPDAAGMTLLPPAAERTDQDPTTAGTDPVASGPTTHVPGRDGTGRDNVAANPGVQWLVRQANQAGDAGPNGHRDPVGPVPPRPDSRWPDPYRRNAVTGPDPADHAGLPPPEPPPTTSRPTGVRP